MESKKIMSRRTVLGLLGVAALSACVTVEDAPTGPTPGFQNPILSGTYSGQWKDGRVLYEDVVYGEGHIRMTRIAGGVGQGSSSLFAPIGGNVWRNQNGSTIKVMTQTSFLWENNRGENDVIYTKQ